MKIQDISFLALFFLPIPLFTFWGFFTVERLTWYAGVFFLVSILSHLRKANDE